MTRVLRELVTFAILCAGLTGLVHLMIVGLALIDPGRVPQ